MIKLAFLISAGTLIFAAIVEHNSRMKKGQNGNNGYSGGFQLKGKPLANNTFNTR